MKNLIFNLGIIAVLVFSSCKKENIDPITSNNQKQTIMVNFSTGNYEVVRQQQLNPDGSFAALIEYTNKSWTINISDSIYSYSLYGYSQNYSMTHDSNFTWMKINVPYKDGNNKDAISVVEATTQYDINEDLFKLIFNNEIRYLKKQ